MSTIDLHRGKKLRDLEAGRKHNNIELVFNARRSGDPVLGKLLDSLIAKLDIKLMEGIKVTRIENASLASCATT
jgi:hypothetical protein